MRSKGETWYDDDAGPLVPMYAVTGGRTQSSRCELDLISLVVANAPDAHAPLVQPEYAAVLWACVYPSSVAEVASAVRMPVGVAKVLIGDLVEYGYITLRSAAHQDAPDLLMLQRVLDGIRNL